MSYKKPIEPTSVGVLDPSTGIITLTGISAGDNQVIGNKRCQSALGSKQYCVTYAKCNSSTCPGDDSNSTDVLSDSTSLSVEPEGVYKIFYRNAGESTAQELVTKYINIKSSQFDSNLESTKVTLDTSANTISFPRSGIFNSKGTYTYCVGTSCTPTQPITCSLTNCTFAFADHTKDHIIGSVKILVKLAGSSKDHTDSIIKSQTAVSKSFTKAISINKCIHAGANQYTLGNCKTCGEVSPDLPFQFNSTCYACPDMTESVKAGSVTGNPVCIRDGFVNVCKEQVNYKDVSLDVAISGSPSQRRCPVAKQDWVSGCKVGVCQSNRLAPNVLVWEGNPLVLGDSDDIKCTATAGGSATCKKCSEKGGGRCDDKKSPCKSCYQKYKV